jgi:predicted phosphate transport protein (TIGR00153 family)
LSEKGSLMDWFGKRRESVVTKAMREHAEKVGDTVAELNRAMTALVRGDRDTALDAMKRLILSEKEADRIEEMITEELSKGDMESKEREDLMHLIRRLDYVADWAKEAGIDLQLILETKVNVPISLWKRYAEMTAELEKAAKALRMSIDALGVDADAVIKYERSVEVSEHILDEMYFSTKKEIFLATELDPRAIYLMRDLLHGIENSADKCKDSADILHILVVSQRHKAKQV